MRRYGIVAISFITLGACSIFNREGPKVTCADLQDGTVNACHDGIIATCSAGQVTYKVCDQESACDQSWQKLGAFRCSESDPAPTASSAPTGSSDGIANTTDAGSKSTAACGFTFANDTCASCIKSNCCDVSTACANDDECRSCASRTGAQTPCVPDLVPSYDAYATCLDQLCQSACAQ